MGKPLEKRRNQQPQSPPRKHATINQSSSSTKQRLSSMITVKLGQTMLAMKRPRRRSFNKLIISCCLMRKRRRKRIIRSLSFSTSIALDYWTPSTRISSGCNEPHSFFACLLNIMVSFNRYLNKEFQTKKLGTTTKSVVYDSETLRAHQPLVLTSTCLPIYPLLNRLLINE